MAGTALEGYGRVSVGNLARAKAMRLLHRYVPSAVAS